jgi:hypothetical protein
VVLEREVHQPPLGGVHGAQFDRLTGLQRAGGGLLGLTAEAFGLTLEVAADIDGDPLPLGELGADGGLDEVGKGAERLAAQPDQELRLD